MIADKLVVFGQEIAQNGCNHYRIKQPLWEIMEQDLTPCYTSTLCDKPEDLTMWIDKCDILMTQNAKSNKLLEYMIDTKEKRIPKKFVIDYDDDIFNVSPYNPAYQYHGTREVDITLDDGSVTKLRDGENGLDIEANKLLLENFARVLKMADLVTCPSPILAGKWKRLNKNVKVIKNFLNFELWKPLPLLKDDKVRIVWQGGYSHFEDWHEVKDALEIILNKHKNVILQIMGTEFKGYTKNFPKDQIEFHHFEKMDVYPHVFKTLNSDIGICPLANNEFNVCKSELKWTEYSSLGICSLASNIPPYSLNIKDGETGFLCQDTKDWVSVLETLIGNRGLVTVIGNQAKEKVRRDYDIKKNASQYIDAFKSLYRKELILV